jgi:hypothetical protein
MSNLSDLNLNNSPFDNIRHAEENGNEYWLARELMLGVGYNTWPKFKRVIEKAKFSCFNSGATIDHHFIPWDNAVERKQGGGAKKQDYKLSRYGCYLVAMNGDPRKPEIAAAQHYFSVKTDESEMLLQTHLMTQLTIIQQQNQQMMATLMASLQQQGMQVQQHTTQLQELTERLDEIERIQEAVIASMEELSPPSVEPLSLSTRLKINRLVRDYALFHKIAYRDVWQRLYTSFRDRYHIDLIARAKNNGKLKPLDICEQLEMIEQLYAVAYELLVRGLPKAS